MATTPGGFFQTWGDGIRAEAGQNQAIADFNTDASALALSPNDYQQLAEEWSGRPDNGAVQIPVYGQADDGYGLLGYETPSEYFARMATDPQVIRNEEVREQERRFLPGETGGIGTQVAIDPVTGALQVSPGVAPMVQAQKEERERQEMILPGETGVIGDQVAIDPVTGALQVSPGVAAEVRAQKEERQRQEMILPGESGVIGNQVNIDPVTGTLQVSSGVIPAVAAAQEERERQEMILPGESGVIGNQVNIDPVTGTLQVSQGVASAAAAAQQEDTVWQPDADIVAVISGDRDGTLTPEDTAKAIGYMVAASKSGTKIHPFQSDSELHPAVDPAVANAWFDRAIRADSNRNLPTLDSIKAASPDLTDDQALQQLTLTALLDKHAAGAAVGAGSIGSIDLSTDLVSRGMNPVEAQRWTKWASDQGLTTYSDWYAVGGAVVGGVAGSYAGRWIPVLTTRINPRLTTGVLRGLLEEGGEETGELFADIIATVASGGNAVGILTDPVTYAYAGGSILFSGVTEADSPNARPRPEAVPVGEEGAGAVFSKTRGPVDPTLLAEGNRLLDRWAASNHALQNQPEDAPPGVDQATWYRRRDALKRDVDQSGADLTTFRADHPGLVVGYKAGGVNVVASDNSLITVSPDGQASLYALQPGDAAFMMTSGGPDARTTYHIDESGNLVPLPSVDNRGLGGAVATVTSSPDSSSSVPGDSVRAQAQQADGSVVAQPALPFLVPVPTTTPSATPRVASVPTAAPSEPLPLGQAVPALQTTPTPTETEGQGGSRGGRSAPPSVADPGGPSTTPPPSPQPPSPQPSPASQPSPAPQPTPRTSTSTTPIITPTPNPDLGQGTQSQPAPTLPAPQPSPAVTLTPFGIPSPLAVATGRPSVALPTPTPTPTVESQPDPQADPQPGTTPNIPTITPTTGTTPTPNSNQTPQRNRDRPDRARRRREIPNPAADDPNRHPREVQFVDRTLHTVDLVTGEHTIEPLDDEQLRTIHIRSFSPENPKGQVRLAGSVQLEVERQHIVAESADRRKDAGDPIDYRDINFAPGQGPARPSAQDLSGIQLRQSPGQIDYRDVNFVKRPARPSAEELSGIQLQDRREPGKGQQIDYRDINFVDRKPGRTESSRTSRTSNSSGRGGKSTGGKSGDLSNINYRPGQGPAPAANRRSANNVDTGLMNGGGATRRRGGGRRRKDEDEDERGYRRPVIQVVLEG